jgi:hypothetical protein
MKQTDEPTPGPTGGKPTLTISPITGCEMNAEDKPTMVMQTFSNLRNVSFCEVILWCGEGGTYGTSGLNDPRDSCPEVLYKGLTTEGLARQYRVESASLNPPRGRRIWILDTLAIPTSTTVRDFNGLKAHYWGELPPGPDGKPMVLNPKLVQYNPVYFKRSSVITFEKGKPVFLLKDAEGTTWVYKNYTTAMDSTLTYEDLPKLNERLKELPAGWKFWTRILDQDLVLTPLGGKARIMWDELGGSWDALDPGTVNYVP